MKEDIKLRDLARRLDDGDNESLRAMVQREVASALRSAACAAAPPGLSMETCDASPSACKDMLSAAPKQEDNVGDLDDDSEESLEVGDGGELQEPELEASPNPARSTTSDFGARERAWRSSAVELQQRRRRHLPRGRRFL